MKIGQRKLELRLRPIPHERAYSQPAQAVVNFVLSTGIPKNKYFVFYRKGSGFLFNLMA